MKAYKAWVDYGEGSTVVFAETRNQAKVIALSCDCCEDAKYTDIRVHRMDELDHLYQGKSEMNWYDDETRLLLVRDFGWACIEPSWECDSCNCKKYCSWHEEEGADNGS